MILRAGLYLEEIPGRSEIKQNDQLSFLYAPHGDLLSQVGLSHCPAAARTFGHAHRAVSGIKSHSPSFQSCIGVTLLGVISVSELI